MGRSCHGHRYVHPAGGWNRALPGRSASAPAHIATGLILLAVSRILAGKSWQAVPLLLLAFLLHPLMAALGISFCFFLTMVLLEPVHHWLRRWRGAATELYGGRLCSPGLGLRAAHARLARRRSSMRNYLFLYRWAWYEWLGALGASGSLLAALAHRPKARRDAVGALCAGRLPLRRLSTGGGHGHAGIPCPDPACSPAADALSPPDLFLS